MHTLAALALSLASAATPAIDDPGAAPSAASVQAQAVNLDAQAPAQAQQGFAATGSAEVKAANGDAKSANDHVAPIGAGAPPPGSAAAALAVVDGAGPALLGSAHTAPASGSAIAGTANIGTQTNSDSHGFPTGSMIPVLGFALCAAAAIVFARKKQVATPKLLQIVETHSVGGRRSIIVARIAGETVLLGSSEAGLTLLLARPGETVGQQEFQPAPQAQPRSQQPAPEHEPESTQASTSWLGKLRLARTDNSPEPTFEELLAQDAAQRTQALGKAAARQPAVEPALLRQPIDPLAESAEDQELRRKLASGRSGRIA